jgi:Domain of unknown function (DUF1911)
MGLTLKNVVETIAEELCVLGITQASSSGIHSLPQRRRARRAAGVLGNAGRDRVFDQLLALRALVDGLTTTLMYPTPYRPLRDALDAGSDEQARLILEFLDGWNDGMAPAYWQGSHTGADAGYFRYWCFELAAFVKELGIRDAAFADHLYYPRDLVHCSRGETK